MVAAVAESFPTNTYEEARNQRLEENKRKFQDLGLTNISKTLSDLTASPKKSLQRVSKPRARNTCLDIEPRRSSRQRNPVQTYRDDVGIELPTLRKRLRSSSSSFGSYLARPLEEVRLASYEERTAAFKAAEKLLDDLQTDNPSFVKSMVRSHVYSCFWLGLPSRFCEDHLSKTGSEMVLEDEDGNEYDAIYIAKRAGLSGGWRGFALEHKLDDGDALVFELTEPTRFKIYTVKVSPLSSQERCNNPVGKENIKNAGKTKPEVKPKSEAHQLRRSKRGTVPEMDGSNTCPDLEPNQRRRSKRGTAPEMDDSKTSPDLEPNQKRRSNRGTAPEMDDSKTSPDYESNQKRRSKRGIVEVDDSEASPDLESNEKRGSKRGIVPEMDDSKTPPNSESNQKRRSVRGIVPEMDDSKTSLKVPPESSQGCEIEQETSPTKKNEVTPKTLRKKTETYGARNTESREGCEVKQEVSTTGTNGNVAKHETEIVAKKPRKKVVKEKLFRKRA